MNDTEIIKGISYSVFSQFQAVKKSFEPQDIMDKDAVEFRQLLYKNSGNRYDELYDIINSVQPDYLKKSDLNNQSLPKNEFLHLFKQFTDEDKLKIYIYYKVYTNKKNMIDEAIREELIENMPKDESWYESSEYDDDYDQLPLKDELQNLVKSYIIRKEEAYLLSKDIYALQLDYEQKYKDAPRDMNTKEYKKKFEDSLEFIATHLEKTGRKVPAKNIRKIHYVSITNKQSIKQEYSLALETMIKDELLLLNPPSKGLGLAANNEQVRQKIPSIAKELAIKSPPKFRI